MLSGKKERISIIAMKMFSDKRLPVSLKRDFAKKNQTTPPQFLMFNVKFEVWFW